MINITTASVNVEEDFQFQGYYGIYFILFVFKKFYRGSAIAGLFLMIHLTCRINNLLTSS